MLSTGETIRYNRHLILPEIGENGQRKLKQAKVLVIGAGGLGCPVLQYLAAAGVGTLGLIDFDKVDESNLQRQILYTPEDIGQYKAAVAKRKLEQQNPYITLNAYTLLLNKDNALEIVSLYDLVIDGSDNFSTRYLVNDACVYLNKPLVFGSIFKFEGQLSVFNYKGGPTYRCLYPEPPAAGEMPNCSETGVLGVLPGICGSLQANEAIKIICGTGEVLSGKLMLFNALENSFSFFDILAIEKNKTISFPGHYDFYCEEKTVGEISSEELRNKLIRREDVQLLDVREESEYHQNNIGGELIPLKNLAENLHRLNPEKLIIVHCQSGVRSKQAAGWLQDQGYKNVLSLKGGLAAYSQ